MIKRTRALKVVEVGRSNSNPDFLKYHAYLVRDGKQEEYPRPVYGKDMQHALRVLNLEIKKENFQKEKNQWKTIALVVATIALISVSALIML